MTDRAAFDTQLEHVSASRVCAWMQAMVVVVGFNFSLVTIWYFPLFRCVAKYCDAYETKENTKLHQE